MSHQNYYDLLGCTMKDTQLHIKNKYQELVLKYHPDKQLVQTDEFIRIQEAYNVLRDCDLRKVYDSELLQNQFDAQPLLFATLTKSELQVSSDSSTLSYPCRCGGMYQLSLSEIGTGNCMVNCEECSLIILVKEDNVTTH